MSQQAMVSMSSNLVELECSACGKKYDASKEKDLCTWGKPLLVRNDLRRAAATLNVEALKSRPRTMWRYTEMLPNDPPVSLGEGMTPLVHAKRLGASMGLQSLYVKDEGLNPTGSFKARGMTAAVTRAKRLGVKALAAPTAGNAGGALAAYAAAAGIPAVIVMPADTPFANVMECQAFGAKVVKLNGLISDCGKYVAENKDREGWYDVSTLKEPYRVEGKKTMGYELWEQFGGKLLPQFVAHGLLAFHAIRLFQRRDVVPSFAVFVLGYVFSAIRNQTVQLYHLRAKRLALHHVRKRSIRGHHDHRGNPRRRRVRRQSASCVPRGGRRQRFHTQPLGSRNRRRHPARLERARRIQPFVLHIQALQSHRGTQPLRMDQWRHSFA